MILIDSDWKKLLVDEIKKEYFVNLLSFVKNEYKTKQIFPNEENIFNAINSCPIDDIKVVIVGQDPYHQPSQAHGLCFSVKKGTKCPPSLMNIKKELYLEYKIPVTSSGDLSAWARQGVLMLNSILTVEKDKPMSHANKGWEVFTKRILQLVCEKNKNVVFMAWGNSAKNVLSGLDMSNHCLISAAHPSPLSAHNGFFNSNVFTKCNEYLRAHNKKQIDWTI